MLYLLGFLDLLSGFTAAALWKGIPLAPWLLWGVTLYLVGKGLFFFLLSRGEPLSLLDIALGVVLAGVALGGQAVAPLAGVDAILLIYKGTISFFPSLRWVSASR
jgi:hypothetical protein